MPDSTSGGPYPSQRHVVVFDVNIYLDVASLLGPPFTWDKFDTAIARCTHSPIPAPKDAAFDSLRAVASCLSGRLAGDETLEVFTNSHIDKLVRGKAQQSRKQNPQTGYRGLGWSPEDASTLVDVLIKGVLQRSVGGTLGATFPDGNPPLDHEDGMVYGACKHLAGEDPLCRVYCVTHDGDFIAAGKNGRLSDHSKVLSPRTFVQMVRAARAHYAMPYKLLK